MAKQGSKYSKDMVDTVNASRQSKGLPLVDSDGIEIIDNTGIPAVNAVDNTGIPAVNAVDNAGSPAATVESVAPPVESGQTGIPSEGADALAQEPDGAENIQTPPPEAPAVSIEDELKRLQQAQKTLKGKYDAEVPRLTKGRKEALKALEEAQAEILRLRVEGLEKKAIAEATSVKQPTAGIEDLARTIENDDYLSPEVKEAIKLLVAQQQRIGQENEQLKRNVDDISQATAKTAEGMFRERVWAGVDTSVFTSTDESDGWNPDFKDWLDSEYASTGAKTSDILETHRRNGDPGRYRAVLLQYVADTKKAGQPSADAPETKATKGVDVKKFVGAPMGASGESTKPAATLSEKSFLTFMEDYSRGVYKSKPQEAEQLFKKYKEVGVFNST